MFSELAAALLVVKITECNEKNEMKCVHTFRTGRHTRQADITLLLQYIYLKIYWSIQKYLAICSISLDK